MSRINPTNNINVNFASYLEGRKSTINAHMVNGIPDYAFDLDMTLRQKINAIPGALPFFTALTSQYAPFFRQETNLKALKVGPNQFPDIHNIVVECARRLGIGIPTVFIQKNPSEINAWTIALEGDTPVIVVTSALLERFTTGELKAVIGHECGHIHNCHNVYNMAEQLIFKSVFVASSPLVQQILEFVSIPLKIAINTWARAAEITCDRAGMICCDDPNDEITCKAKFIYGATFNRSDINIDEALKQFETIRSTPVRYLELGYDHSVPIRRIFADKEFMNSEILYGWRPEWKKPGMQLIGKTELDERCAKYVSVKAGSERK